MAFTIPNNADAFHTHQAEPDSVDIAILVQALNGEGVVSGCTVTAQGSPDMTVAVAVGVVRIDNQLVTVTAGNVTVGAADGTNPRIDLITVNNAGTKACTAGTAAASPVFPAVPADSVALAAVYVPASDTTIASNQITDKRAVLHRRLATFDLDSHPATAATEDDEFEGGGSLDAKWTLVNDTGINQTSHLGHAFIPMTENTGTDNLAARVQMYQTPPAGNQTLGFIAKVAMAITADAFQTEKGEFAAVYLYLMNSVNSEYVSIKANISNLLEANGTIGFASSEKTGDAAFASNFGPVLDLTGFYYLKLVKSTASAYTSANTYTVYFSKNGMVWQQVGTDSITFTANCDRVGLMFRRPKSQNGSPSAEVVVDFFRRID